VTISTEETSVDLYSSFSENLTVRQGRVPLSAMRDD
jgi:hypothetical protein